MAHSSIFLRASYVISVRQTGTLPPPSFRFHLAMDTLALGYVIPAIRAHSGLTPVRQCSCRAYQEKEVVSKVDTTPFIYHPLRSAPEGMGDYGVILYHLFICSSIHFMIPSLEGRGASIEMMFPFGSIIMKRGMPLMP